MIPETQAEFIAWALALNKRYAAKRRKHIRLLYGDHILPPEPEPGVIDAADPHEG